MEEPREQAAHARGPDLQRSAQEENPLKDWEKEQIGPYLYRIKGGGQRVLRLEDFQEIRRGTTPAEVGARLGRPSYWKLDDFSGADAYVYPFEGGLQVQVWFAPGTGRVIWIEVIDPATGRAVKKILD